jgi:hypothetical protein
VKEEERRDRSGWSQAGWSPNITYEKDSLFVNNIRNLEPNTAKVGQCPCGREARPSEGTICTGCRTVSRPQDEQEMLVKGPQGGKTFSTLSTHPLTHSDKPFPCSLCGIRFTRKPDLKKHTYIHTGEKPHECIVCDKAFSQSSNLRSHMITHAEYTRYSCPFCSKRFYHKSDLKNHKYTHTGEKPHKCTVCVKSFAHSGNRNKHMNTHTGHKPFACKHCEKRYYRKVALRRHQDTVHSDTVLDTATTKPLEAEAELTFAPARRTHWSGLGKGGRHDKILLILGGRRWSPPAPNNTKIDMRTQ